MPSKKRNLDSPYKILNSLYRTVCMYTSDACTHAHTYMHIVHTYKNLGGLVQNSMYVCMHLMQAHMHTCTHARMHTCTHSHMLIHTCAPVHGILRELRDDETVDEYVKCKHAYIQNSWRLCVGQYVCMHLMHAHTHTCTHSHMHIHTRISVQGILRELRDDEAVDEYVKRKFLQLDEDNSGR